MADDGAMDKRTGSDSAETPRTITSGGITRALTVIHGAAFVGPSPGAAQTVILDVVRWRDVRLVPQTLDLILDGRQTPEHALQPLVPVVRGHHEIVAAVRYVRNHDRAAHSAVPEWLRRARVVVVTVHLRRRRLETVLGVGDGSCNSQRNESVRVRMHVYVVVDACCAVAQETLVYKRVHAKTCMQSSSFYIAQYEVRRTAQSNLHWQTCSFRHQLGFSGKHSRDTAIRRED